jgi:sigma-B regulation protein RsbU (phosphoserine phosphatase)
MFLGLWDHTSRRFAYSNAGHWPPLVLRPDGSVRKLEASGTVVGLFDRQRWQEDSVDLHPGDLLVAYSDGVTEPENEFGEFGGQRLMELVKANRHMPLARIADLVVAAVRDWIGAAEQPDDILFVLARAK